MSFKRAVTRITMVLFVCGVFLAVAASAGAASGPGATRVLPLRPPASGRVSAATVGDDDIPGTPAPASPITGSLDEEWDYDDVYSIHLNAGEIFRLALNGDAETFFFAMLYSPSSTSLEDAFPVSYSFGQGESEYPTTMEYVVPVSGTYYLDINASSGGVGAYSATYSTAIADADDEVPGVPLPASPVVGTLDSTTDTHDVYKVHLAVGEKLAVSMLSNEANDFYGVLYDPATTSVRLGYPIAYTMGAVYPTSFEFVASQEGDYFLDAAAFTGGGAYTMSYTRTQVVPVYRLFNRKSQSHFYTASLTEKQDVLAKYPATYSLDGIAYSLNPSNGANNAPLYRFYNKRNGSHFYTCSEAEKQKVLTTMSKTYSYDGPAYNVCTSAEPGATSVYRFYNKKNRSHFYTASEAEKATVLATMSGTYKLDGVAFYLAP